MPNPALNPDAASAIPLSLDLSGILVPNRRAASAARVSFVR